MTIYFSENTVLKLTHSLTNNRACVGAHCIVVNGKKNYPKYYSDLVDLLGEDEAKKNFIAVFWDKYHPQYFTAEDGFYSIMRFEINEDQTDFRKIKPTKIKIKNNEGLFSCFRCGTETIKVPGFNSLYTICPKCKI